MRESNVVKMLKKAIKQEHLYNDEELIYMKRELRNLEEQFQNLKKLTSKGFGK